MIKILLLMIFCHIIDDFVLQTKFSFLKQKSWWEKGCKENGLNFDQYKHDYKIALFEHSLEWSIAIMLPSMFLMNLPSYFLIGTVIFNTAIHYIVDNEKANKLTINLVIDQFIHLCQVGMTWAIMYLFI